jgi:purine-cytosine permease-like protein
VAGQTLSALSQGSVSWALGIGLAALIALVVAFMGDKVLHFYQRFAWMPSFIALLILAGCGASRLKIQTETQPAMAYDVLSFASKVVSYTLSWSFSASDFCVYIQPTEPK